MDSTTKRPLSIQSLALTRLDLFMIMNGLFFFFMCVFYYYDRYIQFHGRANVEEFFLYALAIFLFILGIWLKFRSIEVDIQILLLIEFAIFIHFAGGFVEVDGSRLYDYRVQNIRYDKFVHFLNSIMASFVLIHLFRRNHYRIGKLISAAIILSVLGLGAVIEILEFVVALTVDNNGVGTYRNNMLDLVANLFGSALGIALFHFTPCKTPWK